MSEVLVLFVWTKQDEWSDSMRKRAKADKERVVLRSVCADSVEARSILANGKPRIEGVPALIVTERGAKGMKTNVTYDKDEMVVILGTIGISCDDKEDGEEEEVLTNPPLLGSNSVVLGTTGLMEITPMFSRK